MVEEDKNIKHNKKGFREETMEKEKTVIFIKEKFIIFIIGFLIGAIVATSGCIIYNKITEKNNMPFIQNSGNNNQPPGMNDHRNNPNMNEEIQGENPPEREWQNQNDKQKKKEKYNNQQNQMSELDDQNKNGN